VFGNEIYKVCQITFGGFFIAHIKNAKNILYNSELKGIQIQFRGWKK